MSPTSARKPGFPPVERASTASGEVLSSFAPVAVNTWRLKGIATRLSILLLSLLASACGQSEAAGPRRINLAQGFRPQPPAAGPWRSAADGGPALELEPAADGGVWISARLTRESFRGTPFTGVVRSRYPLPPVGTPADGQSRSRLFAHGRNWNEVPLVDGVEKEPPGSYVLARRSLYAVIDPELPPGDNDWEFTVYVDRGREVDGRWHLTLPRYSGDGLPVWPGESQSVECDLPPASCLRFATVAFNSNEHLDQPRGRARFELLLDGELIFDHTQTVHDNPQAEVHLVELPRNGRSDARLTFRVEGPACISAILAPQVGPTESEPDSRPDIMLFLADTFRADNLRVHGGNGLTPNLDRLAEESLVFSRSWSPTSWTLPSQSSMLSGLFPYQHGVVDSKKRLSEDVLTLAERLREAGYRTGAVTGGGYISPAFGFDQGFEWFDYSWSRWDVERTAEGALDFFEGDDGRPSFLFVQTYRAHGPYLSKAGEKGQLEFDEAWLEAWARYLKVSEHWQNGEPMTDDVRAVIDELRRLYDTAVVALDRGFGVLRAQLEERGRWDDSWLIFTSDHGEAFGEHQNYGHGTGLWEELTRVPLLLRGPGLAAGRVEYSASLVDLPMTVANIAGVAPGREWGGLSLLTLGHDRTTFLFDCNLGGEPFTAGAIEGDLKLQFADRLESMSAGELLCAHDLHRDPLELSDLDGELDREQAVRLGQELVNLRRELHSATRALLPEDTHAAMDALGYAGD